MGILRELRDLFAEEWMEIKTDVRKRRRNETRDLTHPIIYTLNRMEGVRVTRNNTGVLDRPEGGKLQYGLGVGSADVVGVVACHCVTVPRHLECLARGQAAHPTATIGRAFCLEVKWPGIKPKDDQMRWMAVVRRLGGFAAVVHSVDEAIEAVDRCRKGLSE